MKERSVLKIQKYMKVALKALSECGLRIARWFWCELIFHSVRSGGLAVAVSLFSTVPASCAMPPTLFGKELKYYGPHKDTKQRLTAQWAAADCRPNIWWCSKIQAAAVLQHLGLQGCSAQPRTCPPHLYGPSSAGLFSLADQWCWNRAQSQATILKKSEINCSCSTSWFALFFVFVFFSIWVNGLFLWPFAGGALVRGETSFSLQCCKMTPMEAKTI